MESSDGNGRAEYMAWNDALAAHFFRTDLADQPVYLFVTEQLIAELGRSLGGGIDAFVAAVRAGPPGVTRSGMCQRALQVAANWRSRPRRYPPYIAYLALFVLAGGHEGGFAPHAYYPRLWDLLGEAGAGQPPSFDRMLTLWDDLEQWSVRDRNGELGAFQARIVGEWVHVGLPLAQTVLTEAERHALPRIFAAADLEPGTVPTSRELRRALTTCGRVAGLRPRTVFALEHAGTSFGEAILDVVADDFQTWGGDSPTRSASGSRGRQLTAGLRWCLALDRTAGRISGQLRCHSRMELPEQGLRLAGTNVEELSCTEFIAGWSAPLCVAATGKTFRPPASAWSVGLSIVDRKAGWRLSLRPARIRAFVEGSAEGLPGLLEVLELPRSRPFYLAVARSAWPSVAGWLEGDCQGWQPIQIDEGLPDGWVFGAVATAPTDTGVLQIEPRLAFADRVSISLVGGVRAGAGTSYLFVAPPQIAVAGAAEGDTLYCSGRPMGSGPSLEQPHPLPPGLPEDVRITIEMRRGDAVLRRGSIYLLSGFAWRMAEPAATLDRFGQLVDAEPGVSGANVPWQPSGSLPPDLLRTPGLSERASPIYFVGRGLGQIACWPRDPLPAWAPVWAIPLGETKGAVVFCGTSVRDAEPLAPLRRDAGRRAKSWVDLLGRRPHRLIPPRDRELKALWRRYREAARALR